MSSVFSQIINKKIPADIVFENEDCIAFMDIMPIQKGHVLVVPKLEVDNIFDYEKTHNSESKELLFQVLYPYVDE